MANLAVDITNNRFGQLEAICPTTKRTHNKAIIWKCFCHACNKECFKSGLKLREGELQSCGCQSRQRSARSAPGSSGFTVLYQSYMKGAKARDLSFDLSKSEFKAIVLQNCYYCGIEGQRKTYGSKGAKLEYGAFVSNGIDRLNPEQGYNIDNCVPCCTQCNFAKGTQSYVQFSDWIKRIKENFTA